MGLPPRQPSLADPTGWPRQSRSPLLSVHLTLRWPPEVHRLSMKGLHTVTSGRWIPRPHPLSQPSRPDSSRSPATRHGDARDPADPTHRGSLTTIPAATSLLCTLSLTYRHSLVLCTFSLGCVSISPCGFPVTWRSQVVLEADDQDLSLSVKKPKTTFHQPHLNPCDISSSELASPLHK